MKIWKWTLTITDRQTIEMPIGAKLLSVQMQGDHPQLWALCNEMVEKTPRYLAIYGTGNPLPSIPGEYVATFQTHGGSLVWHLFYLTENL